MTKKIDFSHKIVLLSFILSIGVVYQHTQLRNTSNYAILLLHDFVFYLVEVCVPMFFMISGYLFFRTFSWDKLLQKYITRAKSLFIPYLIWNIIYAVFMVSLFKLEFIHNLKIYRNGGVILQIINAEFSPLWFVKYLMIFVLVSPIIYILLRNKVVGLIILSIMVLYNIFAYCNGIMTIPINVNENSFTMYNYQMIFYAIGAYSALNLKNFIEEKSKIKSYISIVILTMLCIVYFVFLREHGNVVTSHMFRVTFAAALWFATDLIRDIEIKWWMKISFFIYCSHLILLQPIQGICEIITNRFVPQFMIVPLTVVEYICLPLIVVCIIILVAYLLKKYLLSIWNIITGLRG